MSLSLSNTFQIAALMTGRYGVNPPRSFAYGHVFSESKNEVSLSITHGGFTADKVQTVFERNLCVISSDVNKFEVALGRSKRGREDRDSFVLTHIRENNSEKKFSYQVKKGKIDFTKSPRLDLFQEGFSITYQKLDESTLSFFESLHEGVKRFFCIR